MQQVAFMGQLFLRPFFLRDLPETALDADRLTAGIEKQRLDDMEPVALTIGRHIDFGFLDGIAAVDDLPVVFDIAAGQFFREQVEVGDPDELTLMTLECAAERAVDEGEATVEVFAEDRPRCRGGASRFDVAVRWWPPNRWPGAAVPDGRSPDGRRFEARPVDRH